MSRFLSALKEADVDNLHKLLNHGDKRYLCFTKVSKGGNWCVLLSDGIDVWMQEYDEDNLEALRDLGEINAMDAYLAKFRNGFSAGNLSVAKLDTKVTLAVGPTSSALELDLFEAKAADKKIELQSILFRLAEHCNKLESNLASANQQLERVKANKSGGMGAFMDFGQKKESAQNKAKPTKAGMSVINPTSRKRKAAAGVIFGDDDD